MSSVWIYQGGVLEVDKMKKRIFFWVLNFSMIVSGCSVASSKKDVLENDLNSPVSVSEESVSATESAQTEKNTCRTDESVSSNEDQTKLNDKKQVEFTIKRLETYMYGDMPIGEFIGMGTICFVYEGVRYKGLVSQVSNKGLLYDGLSEQNRVAFEEYLNSKKIDVSPFYTTYVNNRLKIEEMESKILKDRVLVNDHECNVNGISKAYIYTTRTDEKLISACLEYENEEGDTFIARALSDFGDISSVKRIMEFADGELIITGKGWETPGLDVYKEHNSAYLINHVMSLDIIRLNEDEVYEHYEPFMIARFSDEKYAEFAQVTVPWNEDLCFAEITVHDGDSIEYYIALSNMI